MIIKNHFHKKGFAVTLVPEVLFFERRSREPENFELQSRDSKARRNAQASYSFYAVYSVSIIRERTSGARVFCTWLRFKTEACSILEMAYFHLIDSLQFTLPSRICQLKSVFEPLPWKQGPTYFHHLNKI